MIEYSSKEKVLFFMNTYIELKKYEEQIIDSISALKNENLFLVESFDKYSLKYQDAFRTWPRNFDLVDFNRISSRFDVLKQDIEVSYMIKEEEKLKIFEEIDDISEKIEQNNIKIKAYEEELSEIRELIETKKEDLKEKKNILEEYADKMIALDEKINTHQKIIENPKVDDALKKVAESVISSSLSEKVKLQNERKLYLDDKLLIEDLNFMDDEYMKGIVTGEIKPETNYELTDLEKRLLELFENGTSKSKKVVAKVEEVSEDKNSKDDDDSKGGPSSNITDDSKKEETSKNDDSKPEDNPTKEENKPTSLAIVPFEGEPVKKVKKVRRASKDLIEKLKENNKIVLGLLGIGAALALLVAVPLTFPTAVASIGTGVIATGLAYDQAKERVLKK